MFNQRIKNFRPFQLQFRISQEFSRIYRHDLFLSKYHTEGYPTFSWKSLFTILTKKKKIKGNYQIVSVIKLLEYQRLKIIKQKINIYDNLSTRQNYNRKQSKYIHLYSILSQTITTNFINHSIIYKIIGWYNFSNHYEILLKTLLLSKKFQQIVCLLEVLNTMHYQWNHFYGKINNQRIISEVSQFYQKLDKQFLEKIQIKHLKIVEKLLNIHLTIAKKDFYTNYTKLLSIKAGQHMTKSIETSEMVWLFQQYVSSMNDDPILITFFENYLLSHIKSLSSQDINLLMNIYTLKGKINKDIYKDAIRPYIMDHKFSNLTDIAYVLKFLICSEAQDYELLRLVFELIHEQSDKNFQRSQQYYIMHVYTHYLQIKGYKITLREELSQKLIDTCKNKSQKRLSINHYVLSHEISQENIRKNVNKTKQTKYMSKCLQTKTMFMNEFRSSSGSRYQLIFKQKINRLKPKNTIIYQKPNFCCFQLDFVFSNKQKTKFVDIEIQGIQYRFSSGALIRQRQIRNEILRHYNIQVHQIKYQKSLKGDIISQEERKTLEKYFQI